jgi:hypothetical protein
LKARGERHGKTWETGDEARDERWRHKVGDGDGRHKARREMRDGRQIPKVAPC